MSAPWMKFYPADWRADPRLRMCSIGARGLWMEMLCVMHEAEPYGHLLVGPVPVNNRQLAALAGIPVPDCMKFMLELESAGVYSRSDDGNIYSRRMVRDKAKAEKDRENGKGGGNPKISKGVKQGVNPPDNPTPNRGDKAQKLEARQISEPSGSGAERDPRTRLFSEGLGLLAKLTGRGPDACRSLVAKWLKAAEDDAVTVLALIQEADRNRVVEAASWISARLKPQGDSHGNRNSNSRTSGQSAFVDAARRKAQQLFRNDELAGTTDAVQPADRAGTDRTGAAGFAGPLRGAGDGFGGLQLDGGAIIEGEAGPRDEARGGLGNGPDVGFGSRRSA